MPGAILGWDMGTALTMATALGVPPLAATELLPPIEAAMVGRINEQMERSHG